MTVYKAKILNAIFPDSLCSLQVEKWGNFLIENKNKYILNIYYVSKPGKIIVFCLFFFLRARAGGGKKGYFKWNEMIINMQTNLIYPVKHWRSSQRLAKIGILQPCSVPYSPSLAMSW
jgi:hypothetical protein